MPLSDPRSYSRLTAAQKDDMLREVAWYLALMARYRLGPNSLRHNGGATGEPLELFSPGTSERLDVPNVSNV